MSIYQESKLDVLAWVNKKVGATFTFNDLVFSTPVANTPGATKNTRLRVTINPSHPTYKGTVVVGYNRLDLALIGNFPAPKYPPVGEVGDSVYTMIPKIRNSMGIYLTADDLEQTYVEDDGANGRILLKAKPNSFGWVGEYNLILASKPQLSTIFQTTNVNWS